MPNVRDHDASVYLRLQGDALSVGGYESNPIFWEEVAGDFAFGLFDLDWDVFTQHIEGAVNRVPVLERTGIKSTVCGPVDGLVPFTADSVLFEVQNCHIVTLSIVFWRRQLKHRSPEDSRTRMGKRTVGLDTPQTSEFQ
ncbi:UNVERIFIED_CONTAM: hypothetical protein K2H54_049879 [Gekko kuhli]